MMSFTSSMSRPASRWMFPAKWDTSSGRTVPFSRISAVPEMAVRGVFSSWETLAVNSRRRLSRCSRSVTSKITTTAPVRCPSCTTGLARIWRHRFSRRTIRSLRRPARASSTQRRKFSSRLRTSALVSPGTGVSSVSSRRSAAELLLSTRVRVSSTRKPSLILSVMAVNSFCRWRSCSICRRISRLWSRRRVSRGVSSS